MGKIINRLAYFAKIKQRSEDLTEYVAKATGRADSSGSIVAPDGHKPFVKREPYTTDAYAKNIRYAVTYLPKGSREPYAVSNPEVAARAQKVAAGHLGGESNYFINEVLVNNIDVKGASLMFTGWKNKGSILKELKVGLNWVEDDGPFPINSQVRVTYNSLPQYAFSSWSDGNTTNPRIFTMTGNIALGLNTIDVASHKLYFSQEAHGGVTATVDGLAVESGADVYEGQTVVLTGAPETGYRINDWQGVPQGAVISGDTITFTMPTADVTATCVFVVAFSGLKITSLLTDYVTVEDAQYESLNFKYVFQANNAHMWVDWSNPGVWVSTDSETPEEHSSCTIFDDEHTEGYASNIATVGKTTENSLNFSVIGTACAPATGIYYSLDNGLTFTEWETVNDEYPPIAFGGELSNSICLKADCPSWCEYDGEDCNSLGVTNYVNVSGRPTSLLDNDGTTTMDLSDRPSALSYLFMPETGFGLIKSAAGLNLDSTSLGESCYAGMFSSCALLTAPPALPATTLATSCYEFMFGGCSTLTTAPVLPAPVLVEYCYAEMFSGCSSLNNITCLATDVSAEDCTADWLVDTSSTGTFNWNGTTWPNWLLDSDSGIPNGWTPVPARPWLGLKFTSVNAGVNTITPGASSATSLSYQYPGSTEWTSWPTITQVSRIYWSDGSQYGDYYGFDPEQYPDYPYRWQYGNYGTATRNPVAGVDDVYYWNPDYHFLIQNINTEDVFGSVNFNGYVNVKGESTSTTKFALTQPYVVSGKLDSIIVNGDLTEWGTMPDSAFATQFQNDTNIVDASGLVLNSGISTNCYQNMFYCCSNLTGAPALPATTLANYCYAQMFYQCTSLSSPVVLPATTLTDGCYQAMFSGCSSLNNITCLATDVPGNEWSGPTAGWVYDVAPSGTFTRNSTTWPGWARGTSGIPNGWTCTPPEPEFTGLRLVSSGTSYVAFKKSYSSAPSVTIYYSVDQGSSWDTMSPSTNPSTMEFTGEMWLAASNSAYCTTSGYHSSLVVTGDSVTACGNIMSLISRAKYQTLTSFTEARALSYIFAESTAITSIAGLSLPATTLTEYCYAGMFLQCTGLREIPSGFLNAPTTLSKGCYNVMFSRCTALEIIPNNLLPATTLADSCYSTMFYGCTSYAGGMSLPATTLANYCYQMMFQDCTGMSNHVEFASGVTTLAQGCCSQMFQGCNSLAVAVYPNAPTLVNSCYSNMYSNITGPIYADALTATTLAGSCYYSMFKNCTGLTNMPTISATATASGASSCYCQMFQGCTSLSTLSSLGAITTLGSGDMQYMFEGCTSITEIPDGFMPRVTTIPSQCYMYMFMNCTSLQTVSSDAFSTITTLNSNCFLSMFQGCSSLSSAIDIPATQGNAAFGNMFSGCTNLSEVHVAYPNLSNSCLNWLNNVAASGSLYCSPKALLDVNSGSGVPSGWTRHDYAPEDNYECLKVTALNGSTTVTIKKISSAPTLGFQYSVDNGATWNYSAQGSASNASITLPAFSGTMLLRGNNGRTCDSGQTGTSTAVSSYYNNITFSNQVSLSGYLASIFEPVNYRTLSYVNSCAFRGLFKNSTNIMDITGLKLPAATATCSYADLFYGCTGIATLSKNMMPATTNSNGCYFQTFSDCRNLTVAPDLPATNLAQYCYKNTFYNCYKLEGVVDITACTGTPSSSYTPGMFTGAGSNRAAGADNHICVKSPFGSNWRASAGIDSAYWVVSEGLLKTLTFTATNGAVNPTSFVGATGETVTVTAVPDSGYVFSQWDDGSTDNPRTFTIGSASATYNAICNEQPATWEGLKFTATSGGAILTFEQTGTYGGSWPIETSTNNGSTWSSYTMGTEISLASGDSICFRGQKDSTAQSSSSYRRFRIESENIAIAGDITSLLNGTGGVLDLTPYGDGVFRQMFAGEDEYEGRWSYALYNATNLVLPSTTLTPYCYYSMFEYTQGTQPPLDFPATTLAQYCYAYMFDNSACGEGPTGSVFVIHATSPLVSGSTACSGMFSHTGDSFGKIKVGGNLSEWTSENLGLDDHGGGFDIELIS